MATIGHRPELETIPEASFIDTASCRCALRPIAEQGIDYPENTQAWRCIADVTQDVYKGLSGLWYFPVSDDSHVVGRGKARIPGVLVSDTGNGYTARRVDEKRLQVRSIRADQHQSLDDKCTGEVKEREAPTMERSTGPVLVQRDAQNPPNHRPTPSDEDENPFPIEDTSTLDDDSTTSSDEVPEQNRPLSQTTTVEDSIPSDSLPTPSPALGEESPEPSATLDDKGLADATVPSTCIGGDGAVGVPLQDKAGWRETNGCLPGFMCELPVLRACNLKCPNTVFLKVPTTPSTVFPSIVHHWSNAKKLGCWGLIVRRKDCLSLSFARVAHTAPSAARRRSYVQKGITVRSVLMNLPSVARAPCVQKVQSEICPSCLRALSWPSMCLF